MLLVENAENFQAKECSYTRNYWCFKWKDNSSPGSAAGEKKLTTYLGIINKNPDITLDRTRIGGEPRSE